MLLLENILRTLYFRKLRVRLEYSSTNTTDEFLQDGTR